MSKIKKHPYAWVFEELYMKSLFEELFEELYLFFISPVINLYLLLIKDPLLIAL